MTRGGRVVGFDPDALWVRSGATVQRVATPPTHFSLGDLVHIAGSQVTLVARPQRAYPDPEGDVLFFEREGRLMRLHQRAAIVGSVREFFAEEGFLEVETPSVVPSPGLDVHLDAFEVKGRRSPGYLHTSPEYQMKRLLVAGLPAIYQVCRCSRRGELGQRHEPEFTMLEWYRAFAGSAEVMDDTERLVRRAVVALHGTASCVGPSGRTLDLSRPFTRLTMDAAFQQAIGASMWTVLPDEERFFRILTEAIEPTLVEPTFLTEWPRSMASLARAIPGRPEVADRFELFIDAMELANGFGELTCPVEQRQRFEHDQAERSRLGLPVYPIDERFLRSLEEGMPPAGGNALGLDRLVMLVTGASAIDQVVAFGAARL